MKQLSYSLFIINLFTYPISRSISFVFVKDDIKNHQHKEGGIVRDDGSRAGELSSIDHIQPGAEEEDPTHAVKGGLHQEEHQVNGGQGALICPVPVNK